MLEKIGHEASGGQIVKSQKISVFFLIIALLLDKFKQWE